jgi:hypothetical protein
MTWIAASLTLALVAGLWASRPHAIATPGPSPVAGTGAVRELVSAVPFTIREGYVHTWRKEAPRVRAGFLCVFAVDPALVEPRQTAEPVLYVGDQTAERVNHGAQSGRVVAIVPCAVDAAGAPQLDFERTPIWFGAPDLPERIDAAAIRAARALHERSGTARFTHDQVAGALARGGASLDLATRVDLEASAALLILEHSPAEFELADGLLRTQKR